MRLRICINPSQTCRDKQASRSCCPNLHHIEQTSSSACVNRSSSMNGFGNRFPPAVPSVLFVRVFSNKESGCCSVNHTRSKHRLCPITEKMKFHPSDCRKLEKLNPRILLFQIDGMGAQTNPFGFELDKYIQDKGTQWFGMIIATSHQIIAMVMDNSQGVWNPTAHKVPCLGAEIGVFSNLSVYDLVKSQYPERSRHWLYRGLVSPLPMVLNQAAQCLACYCEKRLLWEQQVFCAQFGSTGIFLPLVSYVAPLQSPFVLRSYCSIWIMAILCI